MVRPGHENLVAMTAVNTIADPAIRDVPPHKRNCYFQVCFDTILREMYCTIVTTVRSSKIHTLTSQAVLLWGPSDRISRPLINCGFKYILRYNLSKANGL